jgi:hypothetical protein
MHSNLHYIGGNYIVLRLRILCMYGHTDGCMHQPPAETEKCPSVLFQVRMLHGKITVVIVDQSVPHNVPGEVCASEI